MEKNEEKVKKSAPLQNTGRLLPLPPEPLRGRTAGKWSAGEQFPKRFKHAKLIPSGPSPALSLDDIRLILLQAHQFAAQWKKALQVLSIQMICMLTNLEHYESICNSQSSPAHRSSIEKLSINGTVQQAAALTKLLYIRKVFHFDCPTHEALAFWDAEISEMRKYIRKLTMLN